METIFNVDLAVAGLLVMLAVAIGALVFAYIGDEEERGRHIDWLEEPLATPGASRPHQDSDLRKAA